MQCRREITSEAYTKVLRTIGAWYNEEAKLIKEGTWTLWDSTGIKYLREVDSKDDLHAARRKLTSEFEAVCALFTSGHITRRSALNLLTSLEERAAMFTVLEELLALKITCSKYPHGQQATLVKDWNRTRSVWRRRHIDGVEVGKPNMRAYSGMRLLLVSEPTRCDYKRRVFRASISDVLAPGGDNKGCVQMQLSKPAPANHGMPPPGETAVAQGQRPGARG